MTLLVVGEQVAGGAAYATVADWAANRPAEMVSASARHSQAGEMACTATGELGLGFAAVSMTGSPSPALLYVEAGPDLAHWDQALDGGVAQALADHLILLAGQVKGARA